MKEVKLFREYTRELECHLAALNQSDCCQCGINESQCFLIVEIGRKPGICVKELAEAVNIPVFTSSILQVPFVQTIIGKNHSVGIITANKGSLTREHMRACNITDESNLYVVGLEDCREWRKIFDEPDEPFDMEAVSEEILGAIAKGIEEHPDTAFIVLECTDLPPYAKQIRERFHVPVLDVNTMIGYMAYAIGQMKMYD